jgi:hypothetical protein
MLNAIEIEEKREDSGRIADNATVRRLTTLWVERCTCGGPQPAIWASLAREHDASCGYRQVVETDYRAEAARLVRNRP